MSKELKDTLLLPKTDFPMKGNLGNKEPEIQKKWYDNDIYNKRIKLNEGNEMFILHDGPPYANGNIHVGHALNKTLKDFIVRYNNMNGFNSPFIPGWDTHGLPIETALTKKGKIKRNEIPVNEFRDMCAKYAKEQVSNQMNQFKRLGVLADWENPYLTLNKNYEAEQIRVFASMVEKGVIYKGLKPIYWSPTSESALAEAEIEYKEKKSPSIYVAMKITNGNSILTKGDEVVIWTTTPWTIPANLAVAVGEDIDYVLINVNDRNFIFAKDLIEDVKEKLEFENIEILKEFKGNEIEGVEYEHPIEKRIQPVVIGHHVTTDGGTGIVHIAPGHGEDDFIIGKKYNLDVLCPVNNKGIMTKEAGFVEGLFYEDANKEIGMKLEENGSLLKLKFIKHSYPHDWRTKKPIIFRATPQWFASIDNLKNDMLKNIEDVEWLPKWGETRLGNMVKDRNDWCISRQRVWGLPLPIIYAEDGSEILDPKLIRHIADLFEESGSNIWFEKDIKDILPKDYKHPKSPNGIFEKEKDIMDVWFDSGISHHSVLKARSLKYPADLYLEGSDQYRGWFNSSLSTSIAATGKAPYKKVITHGFVNDAKGRKMSKSLGNTVDPLKISKQYGADILRLWVSSVDYTSDARISDEMIKQVSESYRKIRNTFRFLHGNLFDFDPFKDEIKYEDLHDVDKYILKKFDNLVIKVRESFESYNFQEVYKNINNFISNELSGFYLDFTKDILYIEKYDSKDRRAVQTVYYKLLLELLKMLSPIIPHTTSEMYSYLTYADKGDIYLEDYVKVKNIKLLTFEKWEKFMIFRKDVLKALEEARDKKVIGKSFEAALEIEANDDIKELLGSLNMDLQRILIVSEVNILDKTSNETKIKVSRFEGPECDRCKQYVKVVNSDNICKKCEEIIK